MYHTYEPLVKYKKYVYSELLVRERRSPNVPSELGKKVRTLRKEMGLTLEELADATGSSKSYIWELENKPIARPSAEKVGRIAAVLHVTPEYLLDDEQTSPTISEKDKAFFRKFTALKPDQKAKLRQILEILDKE
jgi:transcriptional regulator with XRE-family HTH domain